MTSLPNILVAIADDWAWPHASAYGCRFVKTPNFDRVAQQGVLIDNCFCPAPSCAPSRASLLSGRHHWQNREASNLWAVFPENLTLYTDLLADAGYHIGYTQKGWAPGDFTTCGRIHNPAGPAYNEHHLDSPTSCTASNDYAANFMSFLEKRPTGSPFCFWYGAKEPHRPYEKGSGVKAGKRLEDVEVPLYLPDCEEVRSDLLDYALEVEWFDEHLGRMLEQLETIGELDNTLIIITGDNGMPFPRSKANVYELGMHVPMAICWGRNIPAGRRITDLMTFVEFAPTFLEAAGLPVPSDMTGRSLLPSLCSEKSGRVCPDRDASFVGMERHAYSRAGCVGYPMRAIRTDEWLYIRNFEPDRWPAGDPPVFGEVDYSPTKCYMLQHKDDPTVRPFFDLAFGRRPPEELYAVQEGYANRENKAIDPKFSAIKNYLWTRLKTCLENTEDPRILGKGEVFDQYVHTRHIGKDINEEEYHTAQDLRADGLIP